MHACILEAYLATRRANSGETNGIAQADGFLEPRVQSNALRLSSAVQFATLGVLRVAFYSQ